MVPRAGFEAQQKDVRERLLHTMDETASPWISISELVNDYGFKKTSADRAMKQLIDDGFVESSGAKRGATYALKSRV
jgi:DNA-binding IclR family transcriptional regulator